MRDDDAELSDDARAILAYARKWGAPFTRTEITDIAPGAAWDPYARWPRTVARVDPIRELVRAGYIEQYEELLVKSDPRGRKTYKRWKLTGVDVPLTLALLLEKLHGAIGEGRSNVEEIKAEILRRFEPRA